MNDIIVNNIISINQISIGFNLNDGNIPLPPIAIDIAGDVDLNILITEIIKLLELNRKFSIEFSDPSSLVEANGKIKLIKETLIEIYVKFNEKIEQINRSKIVDIINN